MWIKYIPSQITWRTAILWQKLYIIEYYTFNLRTTEKLCHIMLYRVNEYILLWAWFERINLVVIGTYCIGSCKSKYHTITKIWGSICTNWPIGIFEYEFKTRVTWRMNLNIWGKNLRNKVISIRCICSLCTKKTNSFRIKSGMCKQFIVLYSACDCRLVPSFQQFLLSNSLSLVVSC